MRANLILERDFDDAVTADDVVSGARESARCFDLHRVQWHGSFLRRDGHAMVCWFSAADLESARLALRDPDTDLSRLWSGNVHESGATAAPNVVVERAFEKPVRFEDIIALARGKPWCFETHRVTPVRSFLSLDGRRMLCLYAAPDAEAVRMAQREAAMPAERIWACSPIAPLS